MAKKNKGAIIKLKAARKALNDLPANQTETPEYHHRNNVVIAAEKSVPWYRR